MFVYFVSYVFQVRSHGLDFANDFIIQVANGTPLPESSYVRITAMAFRKHVQQHVDEGCKWWYNFSLLTIQSLEISLNQSLFKVDFGYLVGESP